MAAAIRFYVSLIPNSKIEDVSAVMGESPAGPSGAGTRMLFGDRQPR